MNKRDYIQVAAALHAVFKSNPSQPTLDAAYDLLIALAAELVDDEPITREGFFHASGATP